MFFRNSLKDLKGKLIKRIDDKEKFINQDIFIRDLYVHPCNVDNSYGESKEHNNQYQQISPLIRLIDHIESLAHIANEYHQKYYCDKKKDNSYAIKADCSNKITRILLNEFSLYTAQPLSMHDYSLLLDAVHTIASNQQQNVHLLLSSIAVITDDNKILNMSLYVQCGKEPKIETVCKTLTTNVDVTYKATTNFTQQDGTAGVPKHFIATEQGKTISGNTVFPVKTAGGAEYMQAVDVCVAHTAAQSKKFVEQLFASDEAKLIPNQVDHIVTSNSVELRQNAAISPYIVQIDPREKHFTTPMINDGRVTNADLRKGKKNKYVAMSMDRMWGGEIVVRNPPHGSDYEVVVSEERRCCHYSKDLQKAIKDKNNQAKRTIVESQLKQVYHDPVLIEKVHTLYQDLLTECKPGIFENLYAEKKYKLKIDAQAAIIKSNNFFQEMYSSEKDPVKFRVQIDNELGKLRGELKDLNRDGVLNTLILKIDNSILAFKQIKDDVLYSNAEEKDVHFSNAKTQEDEFKFHTPAEPESETKDPTVGQPSPVRSSESSLHSELDIDELKQSLRDNLADPIYHSVSSSGPSTFPERVYGLIKSFLDNDNIDFQKMKIEFQEMISKEKSYMGNLPTAILHLEKLLSLIQDEIVKFHVAPMREAANDKVKFTGIATQNSTTPSSSTALTSDAESSMTKSSEREDPLPAIVGEQRRTTGPR